MPEMQVETVGVVGTGIMGCGIADRVSSKGCAVRLLGRSEASVQAAQQRIRAARRLAARRKQIDAEAAAAADARLVPTTAARDLADCQVIIETVVEDLAVKRAVLVDVAEAAGAHALVATNTSALRVAAVGAAWSDPARFLGLHFMNPVPASKVVELVRTDAVSEEALAQARGFCRSLDLQVVEVDDTNGFVVNRLLMLWINEAARMIEEGVASPQQIDRAVRLALGHPMGPASVADFIGLDTVRTELLALRDALGERYAPADLLDRLVADGRVGRKRGQGLLGAGPPST